MLQTQSVYPATLGLLKELMAFEPLQDFNLVGGTALALQLGHRISVDLDFFSNVEFDKDEMLFHLEQQFGKMALSEPKRTPGFALIVDIRKIKVDIIRYEYKLGTSKINPLTMRCL